jgi:hypothetical protein
MAVLVLEALLTGGLCSFTVFQAESMPIVNYFEKLGKVRKINSAEPVATVSKNVTVVLDGLLSSFAGQIEST